MARPAVVDKESSRDLRRLPKAHLHVHLDGAVREETLREVATARSLPLPRLPEDEAYGSFAVFMGAIQATHQLLREPELLRRIVREVVEDAHRDGATWIEVSVWPGLFDGAGASRESWIEAILEARQAASTTCGTGFGLMLAANRHGSPLDAVDVASLAARYAGLGVVSFGLDGDEAAVPPDPFGEAFRVAREAGLLSTPHAGELLGPSSVAIALDALGADRILHGVRAVEDPDLVRRLADSDVCLDVCPTSNVKLRVCREMSEHPLPRLVAAGVACTVNADDPLLFRTSLLAEFDICRAAFGFDDGVLAALAADSVRHSGAPPEVRDDTLIGIEAWLEDT